MAPKTENNRPPKLSQDEFTAMLTAQMKEAVRFALSTILEAEVTTLIGALPAEPTSAASPGLTNATVTTQETWTLRLASYKTWLCLAHEVDSRRSCSSDTLVGGQR